MKDKEEKIDVTLEGGKNSLGGLHPITQITQKICDIFRPLGYQWVESPEVEIETNNFNKLNIPPEHPARDMQDTFYLEGGLLLRTHTSNTEIRILEDDQVKKILKEIKDQHDSNQDLKFFTIGKTYRRDEDDATHSNQFTQLEGIVLGKNISISKLKGVLGWFLQELFGDSHPYRFRPSYFPFTEPSIEVDIQCTNCHGKGCSICKKSGWIEILGSGLLHPQVLKNCGHNPEELSGFAFGCGIERLLMIKYRIEDIRNFYLNDIRFLKQFNIDLK